MITTTYTEIMQNYDPSKNTTSNKLFKYERVKLIGIRAEQIQRGAAPMVEFDPNNFDR
jgi:DNA-directed RNA polymerase subunit K/omega